MDIDSYIDMLDLRAYTGMFAVSAYGEFVGSLGVVGSCRTDAGSWKEQTNVIYPIHVHLSTIIWEHSL